LWDADVDAWFAVLVPDVRSGVELGKFRTHKERKHPRNKIASLEIRE
jgi:hypothetical protein